MTAKQIMSASLVVLLAGTAGPARAEPEAAAPGQDTGEVRDPDTKPPPAEPKRPPTGVFVVGAGYSSIDGFTAMAQIRQDDLFHTGQSLSLSALVSARRQLFDLDYGIPLSTGQSVRFELFDHYQRLPGFERTSVGAGVMVLTPITEHLHSFVGLRVEQVGASVDAVARSELPPIDARGGRLASLRGGFEYATTDSPLLPTRGVQLGIMSSVASHYTGSELNLERIDAWAGIHHAAGPFIVHLTGRATTESTSDGSGVTLAERLVLDSGSIVCGYEPGTIGPTYGGDLMYAARGELELPLFRSIGLSAVGFVDHAGIYDTRSGAGGTGTSTGFGLLWRSPIGPMRFDWAFTPGSKTPAFVFGIGSAF